jgi:lysyl-tRNA synthetase, class II
MLDSLREERLRKLRHLQALKLDVYPAGVRRTSSIAEALKSFSSWSKSKRKIYLIGRVKSIRDQGRIVFLTVADQDGEMQVVVQKSNIKDFELWKDSLDSVDFIEVSGVLFKTKRGERSIEARGLRIITKALLPIPSEFYGLHDVETRLRKRYLDLLTHSKNRELFRKKNIFWKTIREYLTKEGFLEVETPVMEAIPGGADAEPFMTHHNALNTDFYLRISLELALKKLIVGGYEKVFEIGRVFRNEGIDAEHLQDYTASEFYWAYADHEDMMKLVEKLYKSVVKAVTGGTTSVYNGKKINWGKKWPRIDYYKIFKERTGLDLSRVSRDELLRKAEEMSLHPDRSLGRGRLIDLIFKQIRPQLIQPCFLVGHPKDISPLAKADPEDSSRVLRFQVLAAGSELGNGWAELNDPEDQRRRFEEQMKLREAGDKEAQRLDEDFIEALEYGMPPTAGFGLSERIFSVLVDKPIRETVFFPSMRRKE